MARIARRRVLATVCIGRPGRHPGQRAGAGLRPGDDRALAALGRFRAGLRRAAEGQDHAGMPEGARHQAHGRERSTPTTCRRASPRRSSPAPAPTSSWRSTTGRSSMPRASPTSATWPRRSARRRAAITTSPSRSRTVGNKWIGVPWCDRRRAGRLSQILARRGRATTKFPETWDEYRAAGKKLKAKAGRIGQTAGHTFGDAPGWWYPYLWSWGGKEVEADGKTVVLNSKETVESVKFAVALWKETMDEGGLAWDDTNNNRAFLSGTHQRHQQRRLDLYRGQEASPTPTRPRRARR